jgi:two-component system chemotaxis sensor kinase CheA
MKENRPMGPGSGRRIMSDAGIREVFLGEAKEILNNLESDIVRLEEVGYDETTINGIFRAFHTLKGSSGIAGMTEIYEFSHQLENLLDRIRGGEIDVSDSVVDLIFDSIDWIKDEIFSEGGDPEISKKQRADLERRIRAVKGEDVSSAGEREKVAAEKAEKEDTGYHYYRVRAVFRENIFEYGIDPLMVMEDLFSLGEVVVRNVDKSKLPSFSEMDPEKCYLGWEVVLKTDAGRDRVEDVFLFVSEDNQIDIEDITKQYLSAEEEAEKSEFQTEKRLGEILVERGVLSEEELESVVEIQESEKTRLGDIIVKKGMASEDDVQDALKQQDQIKKRIAVSTIRVDTNKLDNLLNILGEIVIGQSTLTRMAEDLDDESAFQLKNALFGLDRSTREFQEQIMSIRMVPIGPTFDQFRRFVRDTAQQLKKKIRLIIEGADVELDKTVIEKIGDPLKHMIRNSIDHGVESEEERVRKGKDPHGTITLKAYHQEGNVYIDIIDDGGGINLEKVKQKAEAQGLIGKDEEVTKEKLLSLLFHPGFSTATAVGDLSGRGVGMDVVKTNIEDLRGTVQLLSEEGKGTTVRIKLPLTMAIIDGMLVKIGESIYIIPLLSVLESIQPKEEDIKTVEKRGEVVQVRGEYVTLIRSYDFFGIEPMYYNPWEALIVLVESGESRVGLMVDDLIGQQQIVIKSLDTNVTRSRAVSGAAILGDGKVALILDVHGLIQDLEV